MKKSTFFKNFPAGVDLDDPIQIPAAFWRSLSDKECYEIVTTGKLNEKQVLFLWTMLDRKDDPPETIQLFIKREDLIRMKMEQDK